MAKPGSVLSQKKGAVVSQLVPKLKESVPPPPPPPRESCQEKLIVVFRFHYQKNSKVSRFEFFSNLFLIEKCPHLLILPDISIFDQKMCLGPQKSGVGAKTSVRSGKPQSQHRGSVYLDGPTLGYLDIVPP